MLAAASWSGLHVPLAVPLWAGLALAVAGFLTPDLAVRADAARVRARFRHALSAFLDLAVISLAAGTGLDQALHDAAAVGDGHAFTRLRHALTTAAITRVPPWQTLARLGTDLDLPELSELAASLALAGSEGARIRASLTAKASALRTHQLTAAEAAAQSATERMSLPVVLLFAGFLTFIAYPAISHVLTTLVSRR